MNTLIITPAILKDKKYSLNKYNTIMLSVFDINTDSQKWVSQNFDSDGVNNTKPLDVVNYIYTKMLTSQGKLILYLGLENRHGWEDFSKQCFHDGTLEFIAHSDWSEHFCDNSGKFGFGMTFCPYFVIGINKKMKTSNTGVWFLPLKDKYYPCNQLYSQIPFTRDECLSVADKVFVLNENIKSFYPSDNLPLSNPFDEYSQSVELGKYFDLMEKPTKTVKCYHYIPAYNINSFGNKSFDNASNIAEIAPKCIDFSTSSYCLLDKESIIFMPEISDKFKVNLRSFIFIPSSMMLNLCVVSMFPVRIGISLKEEYKNLVDIEYVLIQVKETYFRSQFVCYDLSEPTIMLTMANVLKAKIKKLPSIEEQKKIVWEFKQKYKKERDALIYDEDQRLGLIELLEKEKNIKEENLLEITEKLSNEKRKLVQSNPELYKYIEICKKSFSSEVSSKTIDGLYEVLPIYQMKNPSVNFDLHSNAKKSIRFIIEGMILTCKKHGIIPSEYVNTRAIKYLCRSDDAAWEINSDLSLNLLKSWIYANKEMHTISQDKVSSDIFLSVETDFYFYFGYVLQLFDWFADFIRINSDIELNKSKWIHAPENKNMYGVVTNSDKGKNRWVRTKDNDSVKIPYCLTRKYQLGYGSMVLCVNVEKSLKGSYFDVKEFDVINDIAESVSNY